PGVAALARATGVRYGSSLATARALAPAPASAQWRLSENVPARRRTHRGFPRGRTDRAAGPRPPKSAGCPHRLLLVPDRPDHSRRTGARRFPDAPRRRRDCPRCGNARRRRIRGPRSRATLGLAWIL